MRSAEYEMRNENLRERTKKFALEVIKLVENLPSLMNEAKEITAIAVTSIKTARNNQR